MGLTTTRPGKCDAVILRQLGRRDYLPVYHAMQRFTARRSAASADEIWLVEHPPVFTQGLNGKARHIHEAGSIPVVPIDRGGQVTYHGPGQLLAYLLLDLKRLGLGVRGIVSCMEQAVIGLLADYAITAASRQDAPGVYVEGQKIAALGLRIRRGCCYHGLSLNVEMDLAPFSLINPCGYPDLEVTQLRDLGVEESMAQVSRRLLDHLGRQLGYTAFRDEPVEKLFIDDET